MPHPRHLSFYEVPMWVLIVMLVGMQPYNYYTNSGSIRAIMESKEDCMRAKENIDKSLKIDKYRVKASCSFMAHL